MRDGFFGFCELFHLFFIGHIAVILRGETDLFFKQDAEGPDAFKTDLIANFRYGFILRQKVPGFIESFLSEILVRGSFVNLAE
jgi:hypothetical protein